MGRLQSATQRCRTRGRRRRRRNDRLRAPAGAVYRPRCRALRGQRRAHPSRASARHPRDQLAERHGLLRHDGRALARVHRAERRLSREPGRPLQRSRHRDRRALRRPLVLLLDAGILVEFPAGQARSCRLGRARARPELRADARHPGGRADLFAPAPGRARQSRCAARVSTRTRGAPRSPNGGRRGMPM